MIKDLENDKSIEDSVSSISEISQLDEVFNTFDQLQEGTTEEAPSEQQLNANVDNAISGVADTLEHLAEVINRATQSLVMNARRRRTEKEE